MNRAIVGDRHGVTKYLHIFCVIDAGCQWQMMMTIRMVVMMVMVVIGVVVLRVLVRVGNQW